MEALEALRPLDEGRAEHLVDVDGREHEVVRDVGGVEEVRGDGERRGDEDRERDSQGASPRASGAVPWKEAGSGGRSRRTGAP